MKDDARYIREFFDTGKVLLYGPVMAADESSVWQYSKLPMRPKLDSLAKGVLRYAPA